MISESGISDSATSDSDGLVLKSRGTKSAVWIYFGFEADEEGKPKVQDAVICRLCKKSVSAKGGNTSNLLSHLKVHLPQRHLEVKKANSKPSGKDDHAKLARLLPGMHIPVYRDVTIISNTNIEFPIPPNISAYRGKLSSSSCVTSCGHNFITMGVDVLAAY